MVLTLDEVVRTQVVINAPELNLYKIQVGRYINCMHIKNVDGSLRPLSLRDDAKTPADVFDSFELVSDGIISQK